MNAGKVIQVTCEFLKVIKITIALPNNYRLSWKFIWLHLDASPFCEFSEDLRLEKCRALNNASH